jgi:CRP-like cAMP-binding protein
MDKLSPANRLLKLLEPDDLARLARHFEEAHLGPNQVIEEPGRAIEHIYFPERGLASVVAVSGTIEIEIGHFGTEGMTGIHVLSEVTTSLHKVLIQIPVLAFCIQREAFLDVLHERPSARSLFNRYRESFAIQVQQTALANGKFTIEQRLARWLLMCQDRVGDEIPVTHDFLSLMLGVRRAGVTTALHCLEGNQLIASRRKLVVVRDRERLVQTAGESYGVAEAAYHRLVTDYSRLPGGRQNRELSVAN